jgi:hypothetical protein
MEQGKKLSFSLGESTTVFRAKVYAIMACVAENLDRNYKNKDIYLLPDSQTTIKAFSKHWITSKLV